MSITQTVKFTDYLKNELELRYSLMYSRVTGKKNQILDGDYPRLLHNVLRGNKIEVPTTAKAITEHVADELELELIPTLDLIEMLGYTKTGIYNLIRTVKKKNYSMVFVGFGGVGTSTNYWLIKLLELTNQNNLFKKVFVLDRDRIEYSNTVRMPMSLHRSNSPYKVDLYRNTKGLSKLKPELWKFYLTSFYQIHRHQENSFTAEQRFDEDVFYFGAPNMDTRDLLKDKPFLLATHGGDEVSLITKPTIDTNIQVESYGMIKLNVFHMNMLRMTIGLLEFLAKPGIEKWGPGTHLDYNFAKYATETNLFENSRYNMKIDHSGVLGEVA